MSWITSIANICRRWLHGEQAERELNAEVQSYFDILAERLMARGLSREEALRSARLELEGPEQVKEKVRQARMGFAIETTARDIRYAWRTLRKNPGFTVVAVLTLGLGIGANSAIFSLINAVMLRALPVQRPEQLVLLTDPSESGVAMETTEHGIRSILSYREFQQLRLHNTVFSGLFAAQSDVSDVDVLPEGAGESQTLRAHVQLVSGEFFQVLGVKPVVGLCLHSGRGEHLARNPVAVISYGYWQRMFAASPGILEQRYEWAQALFESSVSPLLALEESWLAPMPISGFPSRCSSKCSRAGTICKEPIDTLWLQVMGRLAPGMSLKKAEAGINVTFQQGLGAWSRALPTQRERQLMLEERIQLRPGNRGASALRGEFADPLVLLMAMVGAVLLIACANIANLMLARATGRQREIGVRLALGAVGARLIRQLRQSSSIAALGGALGILLSVAAARLLLALVSNLVHNLSLDIPRDHHVLVFTAAISLFTLLLFGLVPAIRGTRLDINRTLAANARLYRRPNGCTVWPAAGITQVALSFVLLMGAALLVRSLSNLLAQALGYDREHLLMVTLDPAAAGYKGPGAIALYERVREQLRTVPDVRGVT